jgi:hypothetical protein
MKLVTETGVTSKAYTPIVEAEGCPQVVPDVHSFRVEVETAE